jgi:hypothetical protein
MNEKDLILPMDRVPDVTELFGALKIKPTGLAATLMSNVYNQFFIWSTDLRDEYERYYCVEYPSFASYLELAHEIYLDPDALAKRHVLKIKSPGGVVDEAYDGNAMEAILGCLKTLESNREN